ncbi:hypothetical protein D3C75_650800 [compost metagenome]
MHICQIGEHSISPYGRCSTWIIRIRVTFRLHDMCNGIKAKSVHTLLQPPFHHLMQLINDHGILPVQIRLIFGIEVKVIFIGPRIKLPHRTTEIRLPVIRGTSIFSFSPNIVVPFRIILRRSGFNKPWVLM